MKICLIKHVKNLDEIYRLIFLQIEKFMSQLPEQNRPVTDSEGALKRRQALERQVPMHDIDSSACARAFTDEEAVCMQKFVDYSKREAFGQGRVGQTGSSTPVTNNNMVELQNHWVLNF